MMNTQGRHAIVTGAGSGIGCAIAAALAARGDRVAVIDIDEAAARETARSIGAGAAAYRADMSRSVEVDAAIAAAVRDLGPLEIMVNNAGVLDG